MEGEEEVLRNLPRSRPGRRSEKRDGDARAGVSSAAGRRSPRASSDPRTGGADPLGGAARAAAGVAGAGVRVATAMTREVLRRLPRP